MRHNFTTDECYKSVLMTSRLTWQVKTCDYIIIICELKPHHTGFSFVKVDVAITGVKAKD